MEFKKNFQAWKVIEKTVVMESKGIRPIGHVTFSQKDNHFRSLTIKLREYNIIIDLYNTND